MCFRVKRLIAFPPIVVVLLTAAVTASGDKYCKWTDEDGVVHYDQNCPEDVTSDLVTTEGKRSESQIIASEENAKSLEWTPNESAEAIRKSIKSKSVDSEAVNANSDPQGSKDFSKMSADQLDVLCEEEREKRLAPEREQLIKTCVQDTRSSQEHCENYYSDYGDAIRNEDTGLIQRALYVDLPECIAAWEARHKDN